MPKKSAVKITAQTVVLSCVNKKRGGSFSITAGAFSGVKFDSDYIVKGIKYYEDKAVQAGATRAT
ncbi:MAG: hypothetical protein GY881_08585 [Gammaproteobacteria bacterium]|nr:hypothetical protein [Gammaproteobacteria bacterium]